MAVEVFTNDKSMFINPFMTVPKIINTKSKSNTNYEIIKEKFIASQKATLNRLGINFDDRVEICANFANRKCDNIENCKFEHITRKESCEKYKYFHYCKGYCKNFEMNRFCKNSTMCPYSHNIPKTQIFESQYQDISELQYQEQYINKSLDHDINESLNHDINESLDHDINEICAYFAKGKCNSGSKCYFEHIKSNDATKKYKSFRLSKGFCKYFWMNITCKSGSNCMYSHKSRNINTKYRYNKSENKHIDITNEKYHEMLQNEMMELYTDSEPI